MSFSWMQKKSIIEKTQKSSCCRRAMLCGILFSKGVVQDDRICVSVEKKETAEFVSKLIREFYSKQVEITHTEVGGRRFLLSFDSNSAAKYISNIRFDNEFAICKCSMCQSAFFRGVFLASGRISDPKKQYSLEFSVGERTTLLVTLFQKTGLSPKISNKQSGMTVYFKDSAMIEEFFGIAGMNNALFSLMDAKAEGEIRKNVGRIANCMTNNIKRSVDTAGRQVEIINKLIEANLLSSLPEELVATALMRIEHNDLSLSQLAAIAVPAISKPGLSHRLKKITELGEQLLRSKLV